MSETPNPPDSPNPPSPAPEPSQPSSSDVPPASPTPPVPPTPPASVPGTDSTMTAATIAVGPGMGDPADVEKNKVAALLSYVFILWLVPLLTAKDSPFAKYHANQGIMLTIVAFICFVGLGVLWTILYFLPVLNVCGCVSCVAYLVVFVGLLALAIMGILNAVNGKMKPLPFFPVITLIK
jgi:uncharacterized membrane protein